jgi:hypothetical protein
MLYLAVGLTVLACVGPLVIGWLMRRHARGGLPKAWRR